MDRNERIEKNSELVKICIELIIKTIKTKVPEEGNFGGFAYKYEDAETKNIGRIAVEPHTKDHENNRILWLSASIGDSKYSVKSVVAQGTNEELIAYLSEKDRVNEFVERLIELDEKAEDKKGEHPFYKVTN